VASPPPTSSSAISATSYASSARTPVCHQNIHDAADAIIATADAVFRARINRIIAAVAALAPDDPRRIAALAAYDAARALVAEPVVDAAVADSECPNQGSAASAAPRHPEAPVQDQAPPDLNSARKATSVRRAVGGMDLPGMAAGGALEGSDQNLTSTEKFYLWNGHSRPP
jgi:hypothetical protein